MLEDVILLKHSSIRIARTQTIYIDPFKIEKKYNDADFIFITHSHFDHFSPEDIKKVISEKTRVITVPETKQKLMELGFVEQEIVIVKPNSKYEVNGLIFDTVSAYNVKKDFHPKKNNWVGYNIYTGGFWYYIAGDTDNIKEAQKVKCDVAFLPVGGTYTMDYKEAADLANKIMPKVAIPIHYGSIVGTRKDATMFASALNPQIDCEILI